MGRATAAVMQASIRWRIELSSRSPTVRRLSRAPMRSENWRNSVIGATRARMPRRSSSSTTRPFEAGTLRR